MSRGWRFLQQLSLFCLVVLCSFLISQPAAWAHRPHDVVSQVKLSPQFAQDQTLFIMARGNLLRSADGGQSWQRLVQGLDNVSEFSTLSLDQGTGQTLAIATLGDGIYRSEDGGQQWVSVNQGLPNLEITLVQIAPTEPTVMLAASHQGGLYRTENSGQSWVEVLDSKQTFSALEFVTSQQVYAGDRTGQVWGSADGGKTWKVLTKAGSGQIMALASAASPDQAQTLYIGTETAGVFSLSLPTQTLTVHNQGLADLRIQDMTLFPNQPDALMISTWDEGVYLSTNGGKSWLHSQSGLISQQGLIKDQMADSDAVTHFSEIAISEGVEQDQTVFVGGFNGLYKSQNSGQTWAEIETLSLDSVIAMDISPTYGEDGTVAIATYVGKILISEDQGETWRLAMKGIEVPRLSGNFKTPYQDPRRFFDIAFSPNYNQDQTLFATTLWTKYARTHNQGKHWTLGSLSKEVRGLTLALSPQYRTDKTLFITNQKGILFRSTNGGKSFKEIAKIPWGNGNDGPSIAVSPNFAEDQTLFATGDAGIYRSQDRGNTWQPLTAGSAVGKEIGERGALLVVISPDYANDHWVIVGSNGGLFNSTDSGETWQALKIQDFEPDRTLVEGIALSPQGAIDQTLLVSLHGQGLFKSTDQGKTFEAVGDSQLGFARMARVPSAGMPLEFSPNYAQDHTIFGFGAADGAIFRSTDEGNTWKVLPQPDLSSAPPSLGMLEKALISLSFRQETLQQGGMALILALIVYGLTSVLRLDKLLGVNRWPLRLGVTTATFAIAWVMLLKIL